MLELTNSEEPITGRLVTGDGAAHEFVGWLALVRALEEAAAADRGKGSSDAQA